MIRLLSWVLPCDRELASGLVMMSHFERSRTSGLKVKGIVTSLSAVYKKKARGVVTSTAALPEIPSTPGRHSLTVRLLHGC